MHTACKKTRLSILLLLCCSFLHAQQQQHTIDSLKQAFAQARHDTMRVLLLNELINTVPGNEIEAYNQQLLSIIGHNLDQKDAGLHRFYIQFYAIGLNNLAYIYENKGNADTALLLYRKSLEMHRETGNQVEISAVLGNIGYVYKSKGELDTAFSYYEQAMDIALKAGDKRKEANMLNNMGIILSVKGNFVKAQDYYFRALRIAEKNDYLSLRLTCLNSIGGIYSRLNQTDSALAYFRRALVISEKEHQLSINITLLNNMGGLYKDRKQYDTALAYHTRALQLAEQGNMKQHIASSLSSIAAVYNDLGKPDTALPYLQKGIALLEALNDKLLLSFSYVLAGEAYQQKKNAVQAQLFFQKALDAAQQVRSVRNVMRASGGLYAIYKQQGKVGEALVMHELYKKMTDSLQNDNARNALTRMQYQYEYDKKTIADSIRAAQESRIVAANLARERTQRVALAIILALVVIVSFFFFRQQRLNEKLKVARLRNHIAGDLHDDVGSTMSTISILSEVARNSLDEREKATALLNNIGDNSRQLLEKLDDIVWSVNPKNDSFAQMIPRMKQFAVELLGNKGIKLQFDLPEVPEKITLSMEQRRNVYLIYKEALHNIAKYADATNVSVAVRQHDQQLEMTIRDDGKGFDLATARKGNGLANMMARAKALGGDCAISSIEGKGTTITLKMPFK